MNKETVSDKQAIAVIILFIIGTSVIISTGLDAKKDLWISNILSICMTFFMVFIYIHLHYIFPEKTFLDILEVCFGNIIGKVIVIMYTWFSFHIGLLILEDIGFFITTVSFPETPRIFPMLIVIILSLSAVKQGIKLLGRWTEAFLPLIIGFMLLTMLLLIPKMRIGNILPVFSGGIKPILKGTFSAFSFPFGEIVICAMVFSYKKTIKAPYKIYTIGLLIGGIMIFLVSLVNILILGFNTMAITIFPSHLTVSRLDIGTFIQRMEIIASTIFLISAFIKLSICLLATCKGITKVIGYDKYRLIATPVALIMLNFSYFLHEDILDLIEWTQEISPFYKMPFLIIFPIGTLVIAKIKEEKTFLKND